VLILKRRRGEGFSIELAGEKCWVYIHPDQEHLSQVKVAIFASKNAKILREELHETRGPFLPQRGKLKPTSS